MNDHEKNKKYLKILGIDKAKELLKEAGEEAIYASAIVHEWQIETIEEGLRNKKDDDVIAKEAGVCVKTVIRWRNKLFGFKPKKRRHKK